MATTAAMSSRAITPSTPIASHISGGYITAGGQIVQASPANIAGVSLVGNVSSNSLSSQVSTNIRNTSKATSATSNGNVEKSSKQSTVQSQELKNTETLNRLASSLAQEAAQKEASTPNVLIHPIAARALGINVGLDQYIPAEVVMAQQTKLSQEGFKQMVAAEQQRAQALNQQRVLFYDPHTGQWSSSAISIPASATANVTITELRTDKGIEKIAEIKTGDQSRYYRVIGSGTDLKDYIVVQQLMEKPVQKTEYTRRQEPILQPINNTLTAAVPGVTPFGAPNIPITKQVLQSKLGDIDQQITKDNVYFEYDTLSGKLKAYAKTFVTVEKKDNITNVRQEQNKLIYEGDIEGFIKRYDQFKDLANEAALTAGVRTSRMIAQVEKYPEFVRGFATFGHEVTGLFERHIGELIKPPKYDIKITYGGLEKAASFKDAGYSLSYFAPTIALHFTPIGIGARNLGGVGTLMEGTRGLLTTAGFSIATGTLFEGVRSTVTGEPVRPESIKKSAAAFFVGSVPVSIAATTAGKVASTFIRAESPLTFTAKNIITGASSGAAAGGLFWAIEGGRPSEMQQFITTGAVIGGAIGLASSGYSLAKANQLKQQSDFIVRFRVGEETSITESTAKLGKPYLQEKAVVSGSATPIDVGYNVGRIRIEYNPLLERIGFATKGKFYGLDIGQRRLLIGEKEYLGYLRIQQQRPIEPLSVSATSLFREAALAQSTRATLAEGKGLWLRSQSPIIEIDKKLSGLETSIPTLQKRISSGKIVDVPERLTQASGSMFTKEQASAFVERVKGRTVFYGRGTYPFVSEVKDIDVKVFGAFTKQGAQKYLFEEAKRLNLQAVIKDNNLMIQNVKFDVHPAFDTGGYGLGATTDLIGFGYKAYPMQVESVRGSGVYIMHPAETLVRKVATTTYMFKDSLVTEQRRQKDVLQLTEMFKLTKQQQDLSVRSASVSTRPRTFFSYQPSLSVKNSPSMFVSSQTSSVKSVYSTPSSMSLIYPSSRGSYSSKPFPSTFIYSPVSGASYSTTSSTAGRRTSSSIFSSIRSGESYKSFLSTTDYRLMTSSTESIFKERAIEISKTPPLFFPFEFRLGEKGQNSKLKINIKKQYTPSVLAIVAGIKAKKQPTLEKLTPFDIRPVINSNWPSLFFGRGGRYKRS